MRVTDYTTLRDTSVVLSDSYGSVTEDLIKKLEREEKDISEERRTTV
jgi:hypothetical protein